MFRNIGEMYQSSPSLTIPPGDPRGFARSHCPGGRGFAQLSLPGGLGFRIREIFYVWKENYRNSSICFKEKQVLEKQVFLCCFISIFEETLDVCCIFNNIDHFRQFRSF